MMTFRLGQASSLFKAASRIKGVRTCKYDYVFPRLVSHPIRQLFFDSTIKRTWKWIHGTIRYNMPPRYVQVYRAPMQNYLYAVHFIVFVGTLFVVPCTFLFMFSSRSWVVTDEIAEKTGAVQTIEDDSNMYGYLAAFYALTMVMNALVRRFPLRIYHDASSREFVACFLTFVPMRVRKVPFVHGGMKEVTNASMLRRAICQDNYAVGKQRFVLYPRGFQTPHYFNLMMGYEQELKAFDPHDLD